MTVPPEERPVGALVRALDGAKPEDLAELGLADETARQSLLADTEALGLVGACALLAASAPADPAVAAEAPARVAEELAKSLGAGAPSGLGPLLAAYVERHGAHGPDLARRLVGRTIHEFYEVDAFGLSVDDTLRALDLLDRSRGERDARDLARALTRVSRIGARTVLSHIEGQLILVHKVRTEELAPSEIDAPILEFAPRIFAARLFSVLKTLLVEEPRVRLAVVLWGRLRGLVFTRPALVGALDKYIPESPLTIAKILSAPEVAERRRALAREEAGRTDAHAIEQAARDPEAFTRLRA